MREKEFLPVIKEKLGIDCLNEIQQRMMGAATEGNDIILLAPTGSGKTLAFSLPVMKMLRNPGRRLQCVVIAPSRELVIQIAGVMRQLASGYKVTEIYGGHKTEDEINSLSVTPDIIVATPGRLVDHLRRRSTDIIQAGILVLDEFDKSLELGFDQEMKKIVGRMKNLNRVILTSATRTGVLPDFLKLKSPLTIDYSADERDLRSRMRVHRVDVDVRDKLEALATLVRSLRQDGKQRMIVFVNHRESVERITASLKNDRIAVMAYHGALDQRERETAVSAFNNGSCPVMVATDLASRGLDIENVGAIIHYHQALTPETYTHRNGRTARIDRDGDIYVMIGPDEDIREWTEFDDVYYPSQVMSAEMEGDMVTIHIAAGKKEKLSKGDILGFITKQCGLSASQVGKIDVRDHYSLVAVERDMAGEVLEKAKTDKIKGQRRRMSAVD